MNWLMGVKNPAMFDVRGLNESYWIGSWKASWMVRSASFQYSVYKIKKAKT